MCNDAPNRLDQALSRSCGVPTEEADFLGSADSAIAVDTHVHADRVDYRPVAEYWSDGVARRAVLVEHFASVTWAYIKSNVESDPNRLRGAILLPLDHPNTRRLGVLEASSFVRHARVRVSEVAEAESLREVLAQVAGVAAGVSLHVPSEVLVDPRILRVLDGYTEIPIRVEHFACLDHDRATPRHRAAVLAVLARPNVFTMVSGMYAYSLGGYPYATAREDFQAYIAANGTSRLMWSADWNRNDLDPQRSPGYLGEALSFARDICGPHVADLRNVLAHTAERFFGFPPAPARSTVP